MHPNAPTSAKILSILKSGHAVEMWWNDSEEERELHDITMKIRLRPATEEDEEIGKGQAIEERIDEGEVLSSKAVGQPRIDRMVRNRSWTVNKNWRD